MHYSGTIIYGQKLREMTLISSREKSEIFSGRRNSGGVMSGDVDFVLFRQKQ